MFVNFATDKAQYTPLISLSESLCKVKDPSGFFILSRNCNSFSLSITAYASLVLRIHNALTAAYVGAK
ncbi:hypothetical protein X975_21004, partial [Stegodyphus mimosarum]